MDLPAVAEKINALKDSIDKLLAQVTNQPPPPDLQALGDAVDEIKATVDAKLNPAS